ncbi:ABC transporter ATP-binding protein/permease VMR1 [Aspergillus udagawae]|uniref:ABC transporter ATP-binding protein/permease VMR1 n=1 Tax=Aspergillus udagawae TaxID=91492 RepID=A0A8H3XM48_9EURO|nr:ABC transporter ATP-binding protein/permease VMR1 [Aspergillus udagawae]
MLYFGPGTCPQGAIEQDIELDAGHVREVLDPFAQHDDSELPDALTEVRLLPADQDPEGEYTSEGLSNDVFSLDAFIVEGEWNLSQGQKHLLCLARALVSRPKILIMDEVTASIDMESDIRIQRTLRQVVRGIIVLDGGMAVEIGPPAELVMIENGVFRGWVEESGERTVIERMIEDAV